MGYFDSWKTSNGYSEKSTKTSYFEDWKKRMSGQTTETEDKPEEDTYDYDAGAARIERLKYYSDKAKEYNSILSGVAKNPSEQGAKNKAAFDLQNLYAEYDKEFGTKKPTTIKGETSSPLMSNMTVNTVFANNAPKVDFDKLLAEAEQKHNRYAVDKTTSDLYNSIISTENYEDIINKALTEEKSVWQEFIDDYKGGNNVITYAPRAAAVGRYDNKNFTMYSPSWEKGILPTLMTEQEQLVYNWYWGNEEYEKANEYYETLKPYLEERAYAKAEENVYKQSKEKPGFSSVQSIVRSVYGTPTEAIMNAGEAVWEDLTGKGDGNIDRNRTADLVTTARTGVSEDMSPVGRFLYNTAMSGADSLLSGLSFGNAGGVALALSAGSSTYNEALDKGMDENKAATYGLMSAVFEGVFESISLGRLLKEVPVDTWVDVVKNLAISMGVNASEEMATEIANLTYDSIANGEFSQFAELREQGLSFWDIMGKFGLQILESGASGALMGFGFGGIQSGASAVNVVRDTVNTGKGIKNKGLTDAYIESGLQFEGTEAYNAAIKAQKKATNYRVGRLSQTLTKSALQTSFTEATGSKETATNLTDVIMGREVSKSAISDILGNEKALNALNETLGTSIKKDTDTKTFRKEVAEAVVRQTDDVIDSLGKLGDSVKELVRGEIISDKEIDAVLKNEKARAVLSLRTGVEITKDSTVQEVKQALAEANNDYSRAKQAVLFASTLNMGVNGTKAVARLVANSSVSVASAVQAFNAVYQMGKQGKAISEARNPYLSELTMAQRLAAYEYGVMDGLTSKATNEKAAAEAEISRENEVPEGAIVTKGGETIVLVKENTKEQTRIIDMGKKLGVEVAFGKITKKGKNIDGLFDGKVLYINPNTTSGNAAYILFKHEFTHFLEKSTKYDNFLKEVIDSDAFSEWLKNKGFKSDTEYYNKIIADYKQIGKSLDETGAKKEAVANFCAEMLFAEDKSMERFINTLSPDHKRTFGQIIRDFFDWLKNKLGKTDEIADLEKRYAEMFKEFDAKSDGKEGKNALDNTDDGGYNEGTSYAYYVHRKKRRYITSSAEVIRDINWKLRDVYGDVQNAIVNEVAVELGNIIYIVDSGRSDGKITSYTIDKLTVEDAELRQYIIRRINYDALSKGGVSDELSRRFRSKYYRRGESSRRSTLREDLQAINGKPGDNKKGISKGSGRNGSSGDLSDTQAFYTPTNEESSTREILANMMDSVAESEREKNLLAKYKGYLERIDNNKAEIARLKEERKAASKAKKSVFTSKIQSLEKDISDTERRLSNLESMTTIKRLVEKERQAMADEARLAGQMAQGRKDAGAIRRAKEESERLRKSRDKSVESRHKTDVKKKISNTIKTLDSMLRNGTKEKNIHYGLQGAVASALDVIDINQEKLDRYYARLAEIDKQIAELIAGGQTITKRYYELITERVDLQRNKDTFNQKLEKMRDAYQDIQTGEKAKDVAPYYKEEAKFIQGIVEETMKKVKDVAYEDMNLEQLEQVYKMYKMILTTVQNANKVFKGEKLADLIEDAAKMEHDLGDIKKLNEERWIGAEKAREFIWNELTPYYAFNRIGSETLMEYYWDLVRGQDTYAKDGVEARSFAQETRKKYGYDKWDLNKIYTIKDKNGKDFRLNLSHMMSIYAYSKREQAKDHMEKGGFFFNDKETFKKKKNGLLNFIRSNETGYKVDEKVMASILELMAEIDENIIAYVDEMQEYLTKMGEKGNEVSRKMWGINIFKEKFYFPLKSVQDFIYQANTPAETSSLKNDGMTKETRPHANNPIILEEFDNVWNQHVERMSKYHAFVIPIDNLNKLINYGTWADGDSVAVSTMLESRFGSAVNEYLTTFIKDLNGAKGQKVMGWSFVSKLISNFKKTKVAASLSVIVQQPTAILRALSEIDVKYFISLPKAKNLNARWELIRNYAPVAAIKDMGGFDAGSGRSMIDWMSIDTKRGLDKTMSKIDDITMYGAELGDRLGWGSIWTAVEREIAETTDLEEGSEAFYEAVGKRFTEVIVKTQVYDSTLSRSGFMRSKNELVKMAMAFKGEPTLSINMIMDAILQANRGKISKKQMVRTIAAVYASIIAATLAKSLIYALRDDDEDESYLEKYGQAFGGTVTEWFPLTMPLMMLPIFSDIWSVLEGYTLERTDMSLIVDLYNAFTSLDSENKTTYRKIEDLAGAMGGLVGIPAKNILRSFREGYNVFENIFDGVDFGDIGKAFAEGVTGNEASKSESLYNAVMNKDTARINIYRKDYKDESTYTSALKRSLRENDPRVVKSVEQALLGNYTLYNNSKRTISSTSGYGVKITNEAFADERDYVLEKLSAARKARKAGNMTEYNKIIEQLVERGYSRAFILKKLGK